MSEPFTWVFTDVNGKATELTGNPSHRSPQDFRVYTPLYKHPASADVPDAWSVVTDDGHIQYTAMVDKNLGLSFDQSNSFAWQQCNEMIQEWIENGLDAASRYVIRPIALIVTPTKRIQKYEKII